MDRMKTFLMYALMIIGMAIFSNLMLLLYTKTAYAPMEVYAIQCSIPEVTITKAEANYACGRIEGQITNNSEGSLEGKHIKISVYSSHNVCLGDKYISIRTIQPGETKEFSIQYQYENSAYFIVDVVEDVEGIHEVEKEPITKRDMGIAAGIIFLLMGMWYVPI